MPTAPTITITPAQGDSSDTPHAPASTPTVSLTPTPSYSKTPSVEEWEFQNDCAKGVIESYILDITSLIPDVDNKTAKEVFDTLHKEYHLVGGQLKGITSFPFAFPSPTSVIQQIVFQYSRVANHPDAVVGGDHLSRTNSASLLSRFEELEKKVEARKKKKCLNCRREGHLQQDCYRKGGGKEGQYPSWWRNRSGGLLSSSSLNSKVQVVNMSVIAELPQHYALAAIAPRVNIEGTLYRETLLEIEGTGRVRKAVIHDGKEVTLTFENAYHCPNILSNLISISRLDSLGYQVIFGGGQARFYSPKGEHFLTGVGGNGLYCIQQKMTESSALAMCSLCLSQITMLMRKNLVDGLDMVGLTDTLDLPVCGSCRMGAAKRRAFDADVPVKTRLLEHVHINLTGPMKTRAIGGYYYSMPVVDSHSAMLKDYYLQNKEAGNKL
ncbi:hypothetical protein FB446DRAFT_709401 [Lentinula raphanica]|nr:hypothetical protein FB446DRAFT_709401 [Lentinula raphanica]